MKRINGLLLLIICISACKKEDNSDYYYNKFIGDYLYGGKYQLEIDKNYNQSSNTTLNMTFDYLHDPSCPPGFNFFVHEYNFISDPENANLMASGYIKNDTLIIHVKTESSTLDIIALKTSNTP